MNKNKERILMIFIICIAVIVIVYLYLNHLQETYKNTQWSEQRCSTKLKSVEYQLTVITDYKNKLDRLLTESQKAHDTDKTRFKDIMENCAAMKQQAALCHSQFEDLQGECKRVREDYDKLYKEVDKNKASI